MKSVAAPRAIQPAIKVMHYFLEATDGLKENRRVVVGLAIVISLVLVATLAPYIAPNDPIEQHREQRLLSSSWQYPFGTDDLGRCILSRLIYGTCISLQIGVVVVGITALLGTLLGLVAGYLGGIVDEVIMRIVDVLLAFPGIILALVIVGFLGPGGLFNIMIALSVVGWMGYARVVRGCVLSAKEKGFVESARAIGCSDTHIVIRHILPNVLSPVIVLATLGMGNIILSIAALGFLGLGAQPPIPEWGTMLNEGRTFMQTAPHLMIFPGLMIMVVVLAFNFLGDGLRDALDPRLSQVMMK